MGLSKSNHVIHHTMTREEHEFWDSSIVTTDEEESITDPVASATSVTEETLGFYSNSGNTVGSIEVSQPASVSLTVQSEHRHVGSATAPVHKFKDPSSGHTYFDVQYSNDPEDDYQRVEVKTHPTLRHRGTTEKFHPSTASTIVASASCGISTETTRDEWPDLY